MHREQFLAEAGRLISTDRAKDYGDAAENFGRIAALWSSYKGVQFSAVDVAVMMGLVKVSRLAHQPTHQDSWIDACGYFALGGELALDKRDDCDNV